MSLNGYKKTVDHFTVLGLPKPRRKDEFVPSIEVLKAAYRKTLLKYHPDKVEAQEKSASLSSRVTQPRYTIDQITDAYHVLADPSRRAIYVNQFLHSQNQAVSKVSKELAGSGLEVVDLGDLVFHQGDRDQYWSKVCRCGNSYRVSEQQLESTEGDNDIVVQCQGCSLCIVVTFEAVGD